MARRLQACIKCQGKMIEGHQPIDRHGMLTEQKWYIGTPVKAFWTGLRLGGKPMPVSTFRCERCGYLESYAFGE